jgi:hypothetical protein
MSPIGFRSAMAGILAALAFVPANILQAQTPAVELEADYRRPSLRAAETPLLAELRGSSFRYPRLSAFGESTCVSCRPSEIEEIETRIGAMPLYRDWHEDDGPRPDGAAR